MTTDPANTRPRPGAGVFGTNGPVTGSSEMLPGGLLREGAHVQVNYPAPPGVGYVVGKIVDKAGTPAAYLSIERTRGPLAGKRIVIYLGPGVTVEHAPPALGDE